MEKKLNLQVAEIAAQVSAEEESDWSEEDDE